MNVTVQDLYAAYAELERIPATAAAEAKAAAGALEEAQNSGRLAVARSEKDFRERKTAAEQQHAASVARLQQRLDSLIASAGQKGSRPTPNSRAQGGAPGFDAAVAQDADLGRLLAERKRLEHELAELRGRLQREGDMRRATRNDLITLGIAAVGVVLVCLVGANLLGAILAMAVASVIQFRLGRGNSAFMVKRSVSVPGLLHDRRRRSGQTRLIGGLYIVAAMLVSAVMGWGIEFWQSLRTSYADLILAPAMMPWTALTTGWAAWFGVAVGILYGVVLLIQGGRRLSGK